MSEGNHRVNYESKTTDGGTVYKWANRRNWMTVEEIAKHYGIPKKTVEYNILRRVRIDMSPRMYLCIGGPLDGKEMQQKDICAELGYTRSYVGRCCEHGVYTHGIPNYVGGRVHPESREWSGKLGLGLRERTARVDEVKAYEAGFYDGFVSRMTIERAKEKFIPLWCVLGEQKRLYKKGFYLGIHLRMAFGPSNHLDKVATLRQEAIRISQGVEKYFRMLGRAVPRLEPCVDCQWIAVCKKTDKTCARFRNYVGQSDGRSRVPDVNFSESWPQEDVA